MAKIFVTVCILACSTLCAAKAMDNTPSSKDEERGLMSSIFNTEEKLREQCNRKVNGLALTRLANNRAYFFSSTTQIASWTTADTICRNANMHLLTINSIAEYDLVFNEALRLGINVPGFWIGLNDRKVEGIFTWAQNGVAPGLQVWAANQPAVGTASSCVSVVADIATIAASWTVAVTCATEIPFICEVNDDCSAFVTASRPNALAG